MNAPVPTDSASVAEERAARLRRQAEVVAALAPLLPAHALLWHGEDTVPYECDGLTAYRELPLVVARYGRKVNKYFIGAAGRR